MGATECVKFQRPTCTGLKFSIFLIRPITHAYRRFSDSMFGIDMQICPPFKPIYIRNFPDWPGRNDRADILAEDNLDLSQFAQCIMGFLQFWIRMADTSASNPDSIANDNDRPVQNAFLLRQWWQVSLKANGHASVFNRFSPCVPFLGILANSKR